MQNAECRMLASKIAYFARNSAGIITKLFLTRQIKCDTYSNWEPCLGSHFCTAFMHKYGAPILSNVLSEMPSKVLTDTPPICQSTPPLRHKIPFFSSAGDNIYSINNSKDLNHLPFIIIAQ